MTVELSCCEGVMSCSGAEEPSSSISEPSHCREHENTPFNSLIVPVMTSLRMVDDQC